ncbi:MAG TPA: head maturation protease, ClpP-related [Nocardioidaceae bacterium]|nr:head maturation protease, ClpP-related [Nocardioidaceae bacterium]
MKTQSTHLNGLQARAKAASAKQANSRVVVSRGANETNEDGTPATPASAELWLYGTVGGYWWGFDSDDVADALRALGDVDDLLVRLHSFGGSAIEGIAIANLLANHPANVRIVVDGLAASAASMIALAGAELIMSPGSQLMVHDAWMCTCGNAAELRAEADWIDKQSQNYAETYAHRAGNTAAHWREVMLANNGDGTWYSAQETVDAGLASRVENIASTQAPPPMPEPIDLDDDFDMAAAAEWDLEVLIHPAARAVWSSWRHSTGAPKPPSASAVGSITTPEGEFAMAFTPEQLTQMRKDLGLQADADEATIVAALSEAANSAEIVPPTPQVPEGMVLVDSTVLTELREGAADGRTARTELNTQARDRDIDAAIAAGKTTPARREHWVKSYLADPEGTQALLASLEPGLAVPLNEVGHAIAPAENSADDELYTSVFGDEKKGA